MIEDELKKIGKPFEVVVTEKFPFKQTDFRVSLANVKQAKPDAVVGINAAESSGMPALIQQYRQAGIDGIFVGAVGTILPTVFRIAGEAMTGVVSADIYFPDLPPFDGIKENLAFIDAFKKAHNQVPDKGDALGAQALFVWASGGQRHQEPRPQDGGRRDPRQDDQRHDLRRHDLRSQRPGRAQAHAVQGHRRQDREARGPEVAWRCFASRA